MRRVIAFALHCAFFGSVVGVVGCATAEPTSTATPTTAAPKATQLDVDPSVLCQVKAEIDDAQSRLKLADVRDRFNREAVVDRSAQFGAIMSLSDEQERFKKFHDDAVANPKSPVGPLGECFVYATWKMGDQAASRCQTADDLLHGAAIVDVARAELNRRTGKLDEAQNLIDNALSVDNGCPAALIEAARIEAAQGENDKALAMWQRARASWSKCFMCAVEAAKLTETTSTKEASVPLWEAALALQPDAADVLKRYGAALAGSDDKRALAAYERAIAAGQNDVPTLMGAAALAQAAGDDDKALALAEKAAAAQPNEIDAWRMVLAIALKKSPAAPTTTGSAEHAKVLKASTEILRLVEEDLPALAVLARDARKQDKLVDAVVRYEAAGRAIAAGRTAPMAPGDVDAVAKEHAQLLKELKVADKAAKGSANGVIGTVKRTVQDVFVERLKKKKTLRGMIEVAVTVSATGSVDDVEIVKDTLADASVAASVVANLRRATITGGAKRYSFTMEFQ